MKLTKARIKQIIKEEIQKLHESTDLSPEQEKFFGPIFKAGAKKLGYKIKKIYSGMDGPQAEIIIFKASKQTGSSGWEVANFFTRKEAMAAKKVLEDNMLERKIGEKSYQPKITISPESYYLRVWDLQTAGIKFDEKKARELR